MEDGESVEDTLAREVRALWSSVGTPNFVSIEMGLVRVPHSWRVQLREDVDYHDASLNKALKTLFGMSPTDRVSICVDHFVFPMDKGVGLPQYIAQQCTEDLDLHEFL